MTRIITDEDPVNRLEKAAIGEEFPPKSKSPGSTLAYPSCLSGGYCASPPRVKTMSKQVGGTPTLPEHGVTSSMETDSSEPECN
jgi:hypothetical protein